MLSILIPIFNTHCEAFIHDLCTQCRDLEVPIELIAMEDGSTQYVDENREACAAFQNATHIVLPHNIGRSAIRNRLADLARYDWLLFMDCDSAVANGGFLHTYVQCIHELEKSHHTHTVICGGRIYLAQDHYPQDCSLHWTVGTKREPSPSKPNKDKPFLSNNFIIRKDFFNTIRFQESLKGYGHEDTLFGFMIKRNQGCIDYINNPIIHLGLDNNLKFISKYKESIHNLVLLKNEYLTPSEIRQITLLRTAQKLHKTGLLYLLSVLAPYLLKKIERHLNCAKPSIILFDFFKILTISIEFV